ncbi:ribosomal protein S19-domain-containing protein [Blyttiomyces helicus]|uniref:Ribosomal protein S19-domain-containing protein n=1 Tax=Blyttiomyces helicus TaxID=388810 RepID=A0A4P9VZN2_9FUNG|nr:ribosomal protein S19-domain-containing protein [Blyttiomyces helicus]|eukprot:RKO85291.1 ribosomal protein S19-domain-containing protein [Blyttiomyces helicus]
MSIVMARLAGQPTPANIRGMLCHAPTQPADEYDAESAADIKKKRTFRKFTYRGVDLDALLDLSSEQLMELVHSRARRRFQRGLKRKPMGLIKKLRKAKKEAQPNEKPETVKTHLRNMIIVPEMIGSVIGVYNGKTFNQVEIKPEMIGHYLGEFSITYKPVKHGRPGIGATHSSRYGLPLSIGYARLWYRHPRTVMNVN